MLLILSVTVYKLISFYHLSTTLIYLPCCISKSLCRDVSLPKCECVCLYLILCACLCMHVCVSLSLYQSEFFVSSGLSVIYLSFIYLPLCLSQFLCIGLAQFVYLFFLFEFLSDCICVMSFYLYTFLPVYVPLAIS